MSDLDAMMADLLAGVTFYRQGRIDGGVRTGIMLGPASVFERFEIAGEQYDPSLIWSIDLRCNGETLPDTPEEARDWLLSNRDVIREGFARYANILSAGSDPTGDYPLQWSDFADLPPKLTLKIVCTALRRIDALFLSARLRDVGERWDELIQGLEPAFHEAR